MPIELGFSHFLFIELTKLGNSSCLPLGWVQVLGKSPKYGEAWFVIGGG